MARGINKLSALAVQKAKDPGYYGDGGGLWLQVSKLGGKSWVFRYTRNGKTRDMGLGPVHTVSLSEARSKSLEHRKSLLEGIDPLEAKKAKQQAAKLEAARLKTFKECALAYIQANRAGWKNPKHVQQWENTLEAYAYPIIGELAIGAVDTNLVLKVLQQQVGSPSEPAQYWYTKAETASRLTPWPARLAASPAKHPGLVPWQGAFTAMTLESMSCLSQPNLLSKPSKKLRLPVPPSLNIPSI